MLLPYTDLTYYGPGSLATVGLSSPSASVSARGIGRMGLASTSVSTSPRAFLIAARYMSSYSTTAPTAFLSMKGVGRMGVIGKVNELSQDDVTGAVLEGRVEGDLTLKQALRYLLSVAQGNATGLGGPNVAYKSLDGGTTRIAGTVVDGTRTITTRDPA